MPHLRLSAPVLFAFMFQYITGTSVRCNVFYYLLCMCEICFCTRINKTARGKAKLKKNSQGSTDWEDRINPIESKVVEPGFGKGRL